MRLLQRRPLLIVAGWLLAVVLAVGVGVVGIGLVGADLTSRQGAPISEDQVERELRALPSAARASSSAVPAVNPEGRSFPTRAGTVVADCGRILSMAPAQGFAVLEQDEDEGEFQSVSDPNDRLEVDVECVDGVPELRTGPGD